MFWGLGRAGKKARGELFPSYFPHLCERQKCKGSPTSLTVDLRKLRFFAFTVNRFLICAQFYWSLLIGKLV